MTRPTAAHRLAVRLIARACRQLPPAMRDERFREWTAELPAILEDPAITSPLQRTARTLSYLTGIYRSTRYLRRAASPSAASGRFGAIVRGPLLALRSVRSLPLSPAAGPGRAMLARLTDRAAASIFLAQVAARRLGHDHFGPEHILLGVLHEGEGIAVKSLTRLGIDLDTLRDRLEEGAGHGPGAPAGQPIRPSRPRGKKVLESALPEALGHGHNYIGTEHLLLAQFHDDGPAARTLAALGASEGEVRAAIAAELSGSALAPGKAEAASRSRPRWIPGRTAEAERLGREIDRLRELLVQHGVDPGDGPPPST